MKHLTIPELEENKRRAQLAIKMLPIQDNPEARQLFGQIDTIDCLIDAQKKGITHRQALIKRMLKQEEDAVKKANYYA